MTNLLVESKGLASGCGGGVWVLGWGGRATALGTPGCSTLALAVHAALGRGLLGQSVGLSLLVIFSVRPRAALLVAVKEQSQLTLSKDLLVTCRRRVLPKGQTFWAAVVKPGVSAEGVRDAICLSVCPTCPFVMPRAGW